MPEYKFARQTTLDKKANFTAEALRTERRIILKRLQSNSANSASLRQILFERSMRTLRSLRLKHICRRRQRCHGDAANASALQRPGDKAAGFYLFNKLV
jgi:hypothetical protein